MEMVLDSGSREETKRSKLAEGPRRGYGLDFKLGILKETFEPGASVAAVALRHGMNANVIFRWRKLHREGQLGEGAAAAAKQLPAPSLVPVRIVPDEAHAAREAIKPAPRSKSGTIHLALPGGIALRVDADIDDAALRRVLRAVKDLA